MRSKGAPLRHAGKTVADPHLDIVVAKRRQPAASRFRQRAIAFDADHFARKPRQNGRLIARAGADFEHAVIRLPRASCSVI